MSQNKFIITGTGRCGTTYAQAILRICGLNVTHQKVFNFDSEDWEWPADVDGEASFMAANRLYSIKEKEPNTKIIYLQRDLIEVLKSWQKRGVFIGDWQKFYPKLYRNFTGKDGEYAYDAMAALESWVNHIRYYADYTISTNSLSEAPHLLFEAVGRRDLFDMDLVKLIKTDANSRINP